MDKFNNRKSNPFKELWEDFTNWIKSWRDSIVELISELVRFFTIDLWNINIKNQKPLHYYLKVISHTIGIKKKEENTVYQFGKKVKFRLGFYSATLSYLTVLAFVPFIAAMFFTTKGFGLDKELEVVLLEAFSPDLEIVNTIINLARNIITSIESNLFGFISFAIFTWAVIWLIINIEVAFDDIWCAKKTRSFGKQLFYYISFIIISPFILILFLSVLVFISNALGNYGVKIWRFETISAFMQWLIYYGISIIAFSVINKFIPNTKVLWRSAFKASLIAAFGFVVIQFLYTGTQLMVSRTNAVYGVFAAFPLFLIWLNISWKVILLSAQLTASFQEEDIKILESKGINYNFRK